MPFYEFSVVTVAQGSTPEEAWDNAIGQFNEDPGDPPAHKIIDQD